MHCGRRVKRCTRRCSCRRFLWLSCHDSTHGHREPPQLSPRINLWPETERGPSEPETWQSTPRRPLRNFADGDSTCTGISLSSFPSQISDATDVFSISSLSTQSHPSTSPSPSWPSLASSPEFGRPSPASPEFGTFELPCDDQQLSDECQENANQTVLQPSRYYSESECSPRISASGTMDHSSCLSVGVYHSKKSLNLATERLRNCDPPKNWFALPLKLPWAHQYDGKSQPEQSRISGPCKRFKTAIPPLNLESLTACDQQLIRLKTMCKRSDISESSRSSSLSLTLSTESPPVSALQQNRIETCIGLITSRDDEEYTFRARCPIREDLALGSETLPPGMVPSHFIEPHSQPSIGIKMIPNVVHINTKSAELQQNNVVLASRQHVVPLSALPNLSDSLTESRSMPRRTPHIIAVPSKQGALSSKVKGEGLSEQDQANESLGNLHLSPLSST